MLPQPANPQKEVETLDTLLERHGFDRAHHEQLRADLRAGRIGLAQNRLPQSTRIKDVSDADVVDTRAGIDENYIQIGKAALAAGEVGVVTLAGGVGSRWTEGAGVVKALHPFCKFDGKHRTFLEVHLAKTAKAAKDCGFEIPHVFTTGYLTHAPIVERLSKAANYGYRGKVFVSPGRSVGLRLVPTVRDLKFAWKEMPQQKLDEQQEKMRESARSALINWARSLGEASPYTDNHPLQCLHPVGHWYEFANMLRNGTLLKLVESHPSLRFLLLHNVDTLGAHLDAGILGLHIANKAGLSFEVISRRLEDRGGGLARVDGRPRLIEGLSMPTETAEFRLRFYNSMTTWIDVDRVLSTFGLTRAGLKSASQVDEAIRESSRNVPTYLTIKDVKRRWGRGQEDILPVLQFEQLWSDMTAIPQLDSQYLVVTLNRGQQLKQQSQLDGWLRDGSGDATSGICDWAN